MRKFVATSLFLALSACVAPLGDLTAPLRRQPVLGGALVVAPPPGYCIAPDGVTEREDTAIVLIGRCATSPGSSPAVLTAALGGPQSGLGVAGAEAEMLEFFASEEGRAALSARGRAADVSVSERVALDGAALVRFADRGAKNGADRAIQSERWRAVTALRGRLVTLTVAGPAADGLDPAEGQALLKAFLAAMHRANSATSG